MLPALAALAILEGATVGRPLFYWGARPPVITREGAPGTVEAQVLEVHAARDDRGVVVRFTLDRPVREATHLPDGSSISGRLRATLYLDDDDDTGTGFDAGAGDLRTGADHRLEVGTVRVGEDPDEKRGALLVISATLSALAREGGRRVVWRAGDDAAPDQVSGHGEWVEVRLSPAILSLSPGARLILVADDGPRVGRLPR
jgi:hypothetical protein